MQPSQNTDAGEKTSKRNIHGYLLPVFTILAVTIAGILLYQFVYIPRALLATLPNPDLAGIESQVAEEIRNRRILVEKDPRSAEAWGNLGMILDVHGFIQEAVPSYKRATALNPNEFRWTYYCAIALNKIPSVDEALEFFEKSRRLNGDYSPLHVRQGQTFLNTSRLEDAKQTFHYAIRLDSTSSHAYLGLAQIALSEAELETSLAYLRKALDLNPEYREAYRIRSEVLRRFQRFEEAAKELKTAQALPRASKLADPIYEELEAQGLSAVWYRDRGLAFQTEGRLEEAISELSRAMELKPDPQGHNYIGDLLTRNGRFVEAISHYQKAISIAPNYLLPYANLGKIFLALGRDEEAIVWFEKCLRLNPQFPDTYLHLGAIYTKLKRTAEAISTFRRGVKNTRGSLPIVNRLAWLLATGPDQSLRNAREALNLAKAACEKTKYSDPESLDVLAAAYAESGNFKRAVALASKVHGMMIASDQQELARQIQSRLDLYQAKKPYHSK